METQPRSLNTLYKLLWEQIKDEHTTRLIHESSKLEFNGIITYDEMNLLDLSIIVRKNSDFVNNKTFVQRMIKETELTDTNVGEFKM